MADRRLREREPGVPLFAVGGAVLLDAQPPDERRKSEPLDDECSENQRERDEDEEIARRERLPGRQRSHSGKDPVVEHHA